MKLIINGEEQIFEVESMSVFELLEKLGLSKAFVAVAVHSSCVPKSQYTLVQLGDGDSVEVLAPMQGG